MTLCGISSRFQLLSPTERQVTHALLTRSPLSRKPKLSTPFDLHVLGTPPAFVLSQDQTLKKLYLYGTDKSVPYKAFSELICSSKLYSRISLAVINSSYTRFLKQSILIVQGVIVCLTLFNLQGTVIRFVVSAANFYILAQRFPFVKMFFTNFQIYFCAVCCTPGFAARSSHSLTILALRSPFVKH